MAFVRDQRGTVAVLVAVGATAMITLAAFAVETANWYFQAAELQRVADATAMAGAIEYVKDNGCNSNTFPCYTAATNYAVMNGVPANRVSVSVGSSPTGDGNSAIQATLTKNIPLMLSRVFSSNSSVNLSASAYAEIKSLSPPCVEALSPGGTPDIKVTGNVTLTGCSLWSKSNAVGSTQTTASVALSGNSTMNANVYTPGSVYVGGSSAFTGKRISVTQAAVSDFIGKVSAVTTALTTNLSAVQALSGPTVSNPTTGSQTWTGPVSGSCTMTASGPQTYASITINAGTCSPFIVNLSGNFTVGNKSGTHNAAVIVTGNVVVNFGPAADTFNGYIDLSGQTGGCFGLGSVAGATSGTCSAATTSGTYYVGSGNGSYSSTSIISGGGSLVIGPGTFWSAGDLQLTGAGRVNWNPSGNGTSTAKIAGNLLLGTSIYTFGAGVYQIKSNFAFPTTGNCNNTTNSGSLAFNATGTASSLITVGGTGNNAGLCLGGNGNSATYSYSTTGATFILAQAPTIHATGSGAISMAAPCTQTAATTCASSLTGSGIPGLLMAVPQDYTGTLNIPSENSGSLTLAGMLYGKAALLNMQGNVSNSGCFGFIVGTAALSGTANFSTCSTLQGTALGMALVQ